MLCEDMTLTNKFIKRERERKERVKYTHECRWQDDSETFNHLFNSVVWFSSYFSVFLLLLFTLGNNIFFTFSLWISTKISKKKMDRCFADVVSEQKRYAKNQNCYDELNAVMKPKRNVWVWRNTSNVFFCITSLHCCLVWIWNSNYEKWNNVNQNTIEVLWRICLSFLGKLAWKFTLFE